jgi:DNA-binding NarL/FixJ family response regulator
LEESRFRVLVVDDFEPFRRRITEILQNRPDVLVIGEASDGLEAVRKAGALQPDLIVLDIGLPKLNGMEAARRIRETAPQSKILFVSQESSRDFVEEGFRLGASGYIHKSAVRSELLVALRALRRGEKFIGSRFTRHDLTQDPEIETVRPVEIGRCHEVALYPDDGFLLHAFGQFVGAALRDGNPVIVISTESHRDSLLARLQADDSDVEAAHQQGRYISLDAADTLSTFMVNGLPNPSQFLRFANDLILTAARTAEAEGSRVAACGECAPLLLAQGMVEAAVRLEELWDEVARTNAVNILCGYQLNCFRGLEGGRSFQRICAQHSFVIS